MPVIDHGIPARHEARRQIKKAPCFRGWTSQWYEVTSQGIGRKDARATR